MIPNFLWKLALPTSVHVVWDYSNSKQSEYLIFTGQQLVLQLGLVSKGSVSLQRAQPSRKGIEAVKAI